MEPIEKPHPKVNVIATITTVGVLIVVGLFVWRVYQYATAIQSGNFDIESLGFSSQQTLSKRIANAAIPEGEFDVVSEDDPFLGSPDAPVTIVEFADFGCPFSRSSSFVMRSLARRYGDRIQYQYRDFPIEELHPQAQKAAEAGECAADQDKFWAYHDKMYQNQSDLSEERLIRFATELNMDTAQFTRCLKSGEKEAEVLNDYADGIAAGVRGTPTFFINGQRVAGSIPEGVMEIVIEQALRN